MLCPDSNQMSFFLKKEFVLKLLKTARFIVQTKGEGAVRPLSKMYLLIFRVFLDIAY